MEDIIISLIGAIFSGVLATIITLFINYRSEIKRKKAQLVADIFGYRFLINKPEQIEKFYAALNQVPIVFSDDEEVVEAYDRLLENSLSMDSKDRSMKMDEALVTFLKALCKATGIDCKNWNDSKVMKVFGA
mgnify:CR=1 FL=1